MGSPFHFHRLPAIVVGMAVVCLCAGCGSMGVASSNPTAISMWHVYGAQTNSPMDDLIDEFNVSEGDKEGIIVHPTKVTSTYRLQEELLNAQAGNPGAGDMPDLFSSTQRFAKALGTDMLIEWNDYFSKDEIDDFVENFISDGMVDGKLVVFPLTKSTQVCFINGTLFGRFSEETGVTENDLEDWDGFFAAAEQYYAWSGGKPFCSFDYPLLAAEMDAREQGDKAMYDENGWYDDSDESFSEAWYKLSQEIGAGHVIVSDPFGSENVMTGEVCCSIGSSAGILYYNDTVTYEDGTTEPLALDVVSMPHAADGIPMMAYTGVGLSAVVSEPSDFRKKAEAESAFVHWLTDPERNLEFCTKTGYIPVKKESFETLRRYSFEDAGYQNLYKTIETMYDTCVPFSVSQEPSYTEKSSAFYERLRRMQSDRSGYASAEDFAAASSKLLFSFAEDYAAERAEQDA